MKKHALTLCAGLLLGFVGFAQNHDGHDHSATTNTNTATPKPESIKLSETTFDFGKIPQGKPVTHVFTVENIGKDSLKIDNVQASCGCTTPEWSKAAIQPGATSVIKVGYNAANEGPFNKTITIVYNTNQTKVLNITGSVYKGPATSAPVNASLSLLKNN